MEIDLRVEIRRQKGEISELTALRKLDKADNLSLQKRVQVLLKEKDGKPDPIVQTIIKSDPCTRLRVSRGYSSPKDRPSPHTLRAFSQPSVIGSE
jgi:hypothetical protein